MLKRGDQGAEVRQLQQALMELGYDLPRWGADGDLGSETLDALARFLRDHGTEVDEDAETVSDAELALVQKVLAATIGAVSAALTALGYTAARTVVKSTAQSAASG